MGGKGAHRSVQACDDGRMHTPPVPQPYRCEDEQQVGRLRGRPASLSQAQPCVPSCLRSACIACIWHKSTELGRRARQVQGATCNAVVQSDCWRQAAVHVS